MMNLVKMTYAAALVSFAVGNPAYAQMASGSAMKTDGTMSSGAHMKMSAKDTKMMTKCTGMSHDMMMKSRGCKKMMKIHPDMMKGG